MVDLETVCCMCGDVGFPEKLFRCNKCRYRFQHSYCSNYYGEFSEPIEVCDWCQSEERNNTRHGHSKKTIMIGGHETSGSGGRSEYSSSGEKVKQQQSHDSSNDHQRNTGNNKNSSSSGVPSPRTTRRYKLLKDVMC